MVDPEPMPASERRLRVVYSVLFAVLLVGLTAWMANGTLERMGVASDPPTKRYRDFYEFYSGAEALMQGRELFSAGALGYIYPPLLAFLMVPLAMLPLYTAAVVWLAVRVVLMGLAVWLCMDEVVRRFKIRRDAVAMLGIAAVGFLLHVDKLRAEMIMQQSNLLMLLGWVLGLRYLDRRPWLAGLALGFAANIKYVTLLAVPYLLIRGRFKAAGATALSALAWALLPALYLGWDLNATYLRGALAGLLRATNDTPDESGVARIMHLDQMGLSIPRWSMGMTTGDGNMHTSSYLLVLGVASLFMGAIWLLFRRSGVPLFEGRFGPRESRPERESVVLMEWIGLIVVSLAFSPQTNSRHLSQLLLATTCAAALLLERAPGVSRWPVVVGMTVMLAGFGLPPGGSTYLEAVKAWHAMAGPAWCMLLGSLFILHGGLLRATGQFNSLSLTSPPTTPAPQPS